MSAAFWIALGIGFALGATAGLFVASWFARPEGDHHDCAHSLAAERSENEQLRGELARVLGARREQCHHAYSNGFALGVDVRNARRVPTPCFPPAQPKVRS